MVVVVVVLVWGVCFVGVGVGGATAVLLSVILVGMSVLMVLFSRWSSSVSNSCSSTGDHIK